MVTTPNSPDENHISQAGQASPIESPRPPEFHDDGTTPTNTIHPSRGLTSKCQPPPTFEARQMPPDNRTPEGPDRTPERSKRTSEGPDRAPKGGPPPTNQTTTSDMKAGPDFCPMAQAQGKRLMSPSVYVDFHPFAETFRKWEMGMSVDCGVPWVWATMEAAVEKGGPQVNHVRRVHPTHRGGRGLPGCRGLHRSDFLGRVTKATAKEFKSVAFGRGPTTGPQGTHDPGLVLCGPQMQDRMGTKAITARGGGIILQESVNDSMVRLAPDTPMKELGNVLLRILDFMASVPAKEHIHFARWIWPMGTGEW
jgi:hypothetical protein